MPRFGAQTSIRIPVKKEPTCLSSKNKAIMKIKIYELYCKLACGAVLGEGGGGDWGVLMSL